MEMLLSAPSGQINKSIKVLIYLIIFCNTTNKASIIHLQQGEVLSACTPAFSKYCEKFREISLPGLVR